MKRNYRQIRRLWAMMVCGGVLLTLVSCRPPEDGDTSKTNTVSEPVATIGDYVITKDQLTERLAQAVRPQRDMYQLPKPTPTAESVLRQMLAEKAMAMEGRKQGYLEDEMLRSSLRQFRQRQLLRLFLTDYVMENVPVAETEVAEVQQADPNMSREQAEMRVRSSKANAALDAFYGQLAEKLKLEKVRENFARASQIYQRLRTQPVEPRGRTVFWITNKQIRNELTDEEKQIALARFTGGQVTLYDWFQALGQIAPPGRPKNLSTAEGVEGLLDRALKPTLWEAEAVARGYDKKPEFIEQYQAREDMMLFGKIRGEKFKSVTKPTDEEIRAYFEEHAEQFAKSASLEIEQVYCPDLETAEKVKEMVASGTAFEEANTAYGLQEEVQPHNVFPNSEGVFWEPLWPAEPNDVIGPVKGFYQSGICWRVVKVLSKTPAEMRPYSDDLKNQVESALMAERREAIMAAYEAELLEQYSYEIDTDKIADIDPLAVTPVEAAKP